MNVATKLPSRDAAKEILWNRNDGLSWKAAQFLGQVVGLPDRPLSPAQSDWLKSLAERAGIEAELSA